MKALETQGNGSVLAMKALETQGKGAGLATNAVEKTRQRRCPTSLVAGGKYGKRCLAAFICASETCTKPVKRPVNRQ